MSQFIPLPDELLRKVYCYILPAFEYVEYARNLKDYNSTQVAMSFACQDCQDMMYIGDAARKLENLEEISGHLTEQRKYLLVIELFHTNNPRFVRPDSSRALSEYQYLRAFDYEIAQVNMVRLNRNMRLWRGLWEYPDTKEEILLLHDIPEILFNGTTKDLIYSCIINNVRGFGEGLNKYCKNRNGDTHDIVRFINKNYSNIDSCLGSKTNSFRKSLVRSLMRI